MLRPRPNNHDSESCPLFVLAVFSLGSLKILFSVETPLASQRERQNFFKFVSHCPCPLPLNTFQMDLGHAFMFGGYQLMNPRRCQLHRARSVSLKVPLDNFSHSFHTIFLLDVDALERCAPVATNRILSLLSPFVVTSASEGGRGRQGITLVSVKRHGKQNVGGTCSWNSKMSVPPSRSNGKLRSLNT